MTLDGNYADILTRHDLDKLTIEGESAGETSSAGTIVQAGRFIPYTPPSTGARAHAGGYAAHFVEVRVDPGLGTIRVARDVSAVDGGRILNLKAARSQIIGGIAMEAAIRPERGTSWRGKIDSNHRYGSDAHQIPADSWPLKIRPRLLDFRFSVYTLFLCLILI